ncbi:MAG TPA: glycosyltransferase family 2 protein [Bryobacteraceae bacterium]|nr:glycosyltransferase family 2 protein [Bryobacteraceae bacterium]
MPPPTVTVVVPTLAAGDTLADCLRSLENQTFANFDVIVVDNSGSGAVTHTPTQRMRVIANHRNVGFGAAVNQGYCSSSAPYLATLNDDAVASPHWLEALVRAAEARPSAGQRIGMFASEVRLAESGALDSAGMLIAADGSSKQRGHGESPARFSLEHDALFPSGSAAMYRRNMLEEIGLFDESYFLYCEDTDLGLRARWAGWECAYVPGAVVEHQYSHSAGRASSLKAYLVERNRIFTVLKNFPLRMWAGASIAAHLRYWWHAVWMLRGLGKAAEFRDQGNSAWKLPLYVARAHLAAFANFPRLWREHRRIRGSRRISIGEFRALLAQHSISVRKVAEL